MTAGFFHSNFFPTDFFADDFFPEYGLSSAVTGETINIIVYLSSMVYNRALTTRTRDLNFSLSNTKSIRNGVWNG